MKLNIKNFGNLSHYFKGTDYSMRAFFQAGDSYQITVAHRRMPDRYVFIIDRNGYITGGEPHFSTHVEGYSNPGYVTWRFMRDPSAVVRHIIASIEHK